MKSNQWKPAMVVVVLTLLVQGMAMLLAGCGPEATPTPVPVKPTASATQVPTAETDEAGGLPALPTGSVVDAFEGEDFDDRWWSYIEEGSGSFACTPDQPGHASAHAMRLAFEVGVDGYAGCGIDVDPDQWENAGGLSFFWRADQPGLTITVVLDMEDPTQTNPEAEGVTPFQAELQTPGQEWAPIGLGWEGFSKAEWVGEGGVDALDPTHVVALYFEVIGEQSGSVWFDDLQLMTSLDVAAPVPTVPPIAIATRPPTESMLDKWNLWGDGPHLRGVDMHPCRLFTVDDCLQPISYQDVQDLRNLGANLINASYPGTFTEEAPYEVNPTTLAYLDDLIGWAEEVGIYVVIHFRTGPGRNEGAILMEGDPLFDVWSDQAAHDAWVEMWRFTAERYRGSPVVVGYDLMVEPHPNTLIDPDWELEPAEVQAQAEGTLMDWNAFAAEITAAIRQVDPDTPIIVNSLGWAAAEWFSVLQPTGDPRTVYSLHAYDPDVYVVQEEGEATIRYPDVVDDYGEMITFDRAWLDENYRPVREFARQHGVPIYVGEFGAVRWVPDAAAFLYDQTDLFEQYGWNYAVYVWRGDEPYFDGFNLEHGPDPENHTPIFDNPLLGIFHERWAQNVDFPGSAASEEATQPAEQTPGQSAAESPEPKAVPLAGASTLQRDFALPIPLFAPDSAWNQAATTAAVLPESDQQILVTYRVLRGDITSLYGYEEPATTWPFMDISLDDYTVPVFRAGTGQQNVLLCNYEGNREWPHPKFGIAQEGGPVTVPAPAGMVRPAGPEDTDADGHLVLYNPETFEEYDFWQATTVRNAECESLGGGQTGTTILEVGVVDFFDVRGAGANPDSYYSARAHGTPLLAGLILPEDVESGAIAHALSVAIPGPRNTSADPSEPLASDYFYPASTTETDFFNTNPYSLAAGQRIRLKQTIVDDEGNLIDESRLAPITRMFLTALRTYGAYLVDNAAGFSFTAEDIHTAVLHLSDDEVNALIGQPPGTPLPADMTKWQVVIEKLTEELELIPIAYGPWEEGQDPATATIEISNFEVVEPAAVP